MKKKCAVSVNKKLIDWIKVQQPGPFDLNANQPTTNVFIADFIELNNFEFCRTVVELNNKIFKELLCKCSSDKNSNKYNENDNVTPDLNNMQTNDKSDNNNAIVDVQL